MEVFKEPVKIWDNWPDPALGPDDALVEGATDSVLTVESVAIISSCFPYGQISDGLHPPIALANLRPRTMQMVRADGPTLAGPYP